ncbi:MAG: NRDE family protein, partial [Gammaproteobacteria bacterium]|nr:NRDE family protein [Gammaproteobacteria bacterium]
DTPAEDDQPRSAIFVRGDLYGTRSSSIVAFGPQGRILFMERSFAADGRVLDTRQFEFERIS